MQAEMFIALFVVGLGFATILGVFASSYRLWKRRWQFIPAAAGLHGVGMAGAISLTVVRPGRP